MKAILLTLFTFMTSVYADIHCGNPQSPMEIMICSQYFYAEDFGQSPTRCEHEATPGQTAELTLANGRSARPLPGLTSGFSRDGADCTDFIRRDGSLGSSGRIVRDYIASSSRRNHFLNPRHIAEACPRWNNMSEAEREHFWVWSIASIAWDESRCVSGRRNTAATHGVGVGLLQLNEDYGGRSWRGPNCRVQSVRSDENNLKCGLDIMAELLEGPNGEYRGSGAIFRNNNRNTSYWEKLKRPGGGTIGNLIKSYPYCLSVSI